MYLVEFLEFLTHFLKLSVTGPMRVARWHSRGRAEVIAPISDQRRSLKNSRAIAYNRAKSVHPSAASLPGTKQILHSQLANRSASTHMITILLETRSKDYVTCDYEIDANLLYPAP